MTRPHSEDLRERIVWAGNGAPAANAVANDAVPWAVPAPVHAIRFGARIRPSFNNDDCQVK
jgi:hypothetical protein